MPQGAQPRTPQIDHTLDLDAWPGAHNKISYEAGAIEELNLNQSLVNILEGTKPAFENRGRKHD